MRILLVSQMYPGPADPDLGVFVRDLERELVALGHEVRRAVLDRRGGGKLRHIGLWRAARREARAFDPEVVYAHFLVPAGLAAALASRAPLVVTAHGQDVANVGRVPGIGLLTRWVVRRAAAVVAVSGYLRDELERKAPAARGKVTVIDCGVDLARFAVSPRREHDGTAFLCVGALSERKNVVRLADAFAQLGTGTLTFAGDGPLRAQLEGRERVTLLGAVEHDRIPELLAQADVLCQPSLLEPFGQAALEGLAAGRPVVGTRVGGPPELVPAAGGVLVDPLDLDSIEAGLRAAAALPVPNEVARAAAERHGLSAQALRVEEILFRAADRDPRA